MARSMNKVQLIGNLTRDPEMRYTPSGTAVCTFSVATNRSWRTDSGENREDVEFHRVVAWSKLAEICGQYLKKGSKVYVEGRIQSRKWQTKEGEDRTTFEIVISEMMMLDSKGSTGSYDGPEQSDEDFDIPDDFGDDSDDNSSSKKESKSINTKKEEKKDDSSSEDSDDDIPF